MDAFIERLTAEKTDLATKLEKLDAFIEAPNFEKVDPVQKILLAAQAKTMHAYLNILTRRLSLLTA